MDLVENKLPVDVKKWFWDRDNCDLKNGRCVKNHPPKTVKKMVKKGKTVHPKN